METKKNSGAVGTSELNELINEINKGSGAEFSLGGSYGNYDLWAKDKEGNSRRIESGSKKDIRNSLIKNRYNKKYTKYAKGGGVGSKVKPFEYSESGSTIYVHGTKGDVKKMYLDYVNNFLTISAFADYYGITEKQAKKIIESGRHYANEDGHYAKGGTTSGFIYSIGGL